MSGTGGAPFSAKMPSLGTGGGDLFSQAKGFWGGSAATGTANSRGHHSYDVESGTSSAGAAGGMAIGGGGGSADLFSNFGAVGGFFKGVGVKAGIAADTSAPGELTEASYTDEFNEMSSLSPQQRLYGFLLAIAMGAVFIWISIGFVLSGTIALFAKKFAFFFTCGNAFIVCAPSFLVGPRRQLASMAEGHRQHAVGLYVGCTVLTLFSALYLRSSLLAVAFAVAQVGSVVWYGLSFIPFARQVLGYTYTYLAVLLRPLLSAAWLVVSQLAGCCWRVVSR